MLNKAIAFYFEDEFVYGTDTMILWWRKAFVDLEHCPENSVRRASLKILNQLEILRRDEDYFFSLLDKFNDPELYPVLLVSFYDFLTTFSDNG